METAQVALGDICSELLSSTRPLNSVCVETPEIGFENTDEGLRILTCNQKLKISPHALDQFCSAVGVPGGYVARCPVELQVENLTHWAPRFGKPGRRTVKLRIDEDRRQIEAAFSPDYAEYDPGDMLADIKESMGDTPVVVYRKQAENYGLSLHVILPGKQWGIVEADNPETYGVGMFFGNSGIGIRRCSVKLAVVRLACTNGMIAPVASGIGFARRHLGQFSSMRSFMPEFARGIDNYKDEFGIRIDQASKTMVVPQEWASDWHRIRDYRKQIKDQHFKRARWATDEVMERVGELAENGYGRSKLGIVNGLTHYSQSLHSEEAATLINEYAGGMIFQAFDREAE